LHDYGGHAAPLIAENNQIGAALLTEVIASRCDDPSLQMRMSVLVARAVEEGII
jgi:hypothetical protein